jgi:hypothetical protein
MAGSYKGLALRRPWVEGSKRAESRFRVPAGGPETALNTQAETMRLRTAAAIQHKSEKLLNSITPFIFFDLLTASRDSPNHGLGR